MIKYILRRFVNYAILTALATVFAYIAASSFFHPRNRYLGRNPPLDESSIDAILTAQGINDKDPVLLRTWWWIERIVTAPFSDKLGKDTSGSPVITEMLGDPSSWLFFWEQGWLGRAGVSLRLLIIGSILAALLGVAAGVWSAVRQYKATDQAISYISYILISMPTFVGGVLLMIAATKINQLLGGQVIRFTGAYTPGGVTGFWATLWDYTSHLLLPTIALMLFGAAGYSRYQRAVMLDVLGSDFIRTARAKGGPPAREPDQARPARRADPDVHLLRVLLRNPRGRVRVPRDRVLVGGHGPVRHRGRAEVRCERAGGQCHVLGRDHPVRLHSVRVPLRRARSESEGLTDVHAFHPLPQGAAEAPAEIDPLAEVVEQDAVADAAVQRPVSRNGLVWRRLKRKPNFWIGGGITLAIILFALFGNIPNIYAVGQQDPYGFNAAPGAQHWFGADAIGIDLYASITAALRKSLLIGFIAAPPAATIIAALIGSLAGYLGGPLELFHGWLVNLLLVLPVFYVLMIISPPLLSSMSWMVLVVAIALFGWMIMSQIVKNQTKSLREREFVLAARFTGVGDVQDPHPPHHPERVLAADRRRDAGRLLRDPRRDVPVVLRPGHPAAGRLPGHPAAGRHLGGGLPPPLAVHLPPRRVPGHPADRRVPRRRRPARRPRPDQRHRAVMTSRVRSPRQRASPPSALRHPSVP